MKTFALVVFAIHTLFELLFGLNAFISGASSSQSAAQIAEQSTQMTISFRFLGSALLAMGALGAIVIFKAGVQSVAAKYIAMGFVVFHGLGTIGSLWSAAPTFEVYTQALALGALILHGALAIGFAIIAIGLKPDKSL